MITAVDTSVLIAIAKGEPEAHRWADVLVAARAEGDLVICDVVAAEFFTLLLDERKVQQSLNGLGIVFSAAALDAARLAGRLFQYSHLVE